MKFSPVLIVFFTVFLDLLGFGILIPLSPFFAKEFGADGLTFGLLMTVYSVMQFIFSPLLGRLSDRVGRRPVMLISLAASTMGYVIFALAQSLTWLFVSRMIAGIGAANISTAQAIIADITPPDKRTRGMAIVGMAIGFGFCFGPGVAFLLLQDNNYAPVFWAAAVLSGLDFIFTYFLLPETRTATGTEAVIEKRFSFSRFRMALSLPIVSTLLISSLVYYTSFSMMEVTLGLFGENAFQLTAHGFSGIMFFVGMVMAFVQGGLVHQVAKRIGDFNTLRFGMMGIVVGLILLSLTPNITWLWCAVGLLGFFAGLSTPALTSLVSQYSPSDMQGGMLGLNQSMASLGRILGPVLGGLCFDYIHIRAPFPVGAVLVFLALIFLMTLKPPAPGTVK